MSTWESWLVSNALEIILIFGGGFLAFMKMSGFQSRVGNKVETNEKAFADHLKSEVPHLSCSIEAEKLKSIIQRLERMEGKIDNMGDKLLEMVSGRKRGDLK